MTLGGEGGTVYTVSSTADSGSNTLRAALEASGLRIVDVQIPGADIALESNIEVHDPYLTADLKALTLNGYGIRVATHDVILRYVKVRDAWNAITVYALTGVDTYNIQIDHCEGWYCGDDPFIVYSESGKGNIYNVRLEYNLSYGSLTNEGSTVTGGKGWIIGRSEDGGTVQIEGRYNLIWNHADRIPLVSGDSTDALVSVAWYNNVAGNSWRMSEWRWSLRAYIVNNVFINGPNTLVKPFGELRLIPDTDEASKGIHAPYSTVYHKGNQAWDFDYPGQKRDVIIVTGAAGFDGYNPEPGVPDEFKFLGGVMDCDAAYDHVLQNAGCILPYPDALTLRAIAEVKTRVGLALGAEDLTEESFHPENYIQTWGFGWETVGGAGGQIVDITSREKMGDGTVHYALTQVTGPRILNFKVGGYFPFVNANQIQLLNGYVTMDAATAPEPVIFYNPTGEALGGVGAILHFGDKRSSGATPDPDFGQVIIRHITFQHGNGQRDQSGGVNFHYGHHLLLENCSLRWSVDNLIGGWLWPYDPYLEDVTLQYCHLQEPFAAHGTGVAIHGWGEPEQAGATDYKRIRRVSVTRNLFTHVGWRIPVSVTAGLSFDTNVIYNWSYLLWQTQQEDVSDWRNNYVIPGPDSQGYLGFIHEHGQWGAPNPASLYIDGNLIIGRNPLEDQWTQVRDTDTGDQLSDTHRRLMPLVVPNQGLLAPDGNMFAHIVALAGAIKPYPHWIDTLYKRQVLHNLGKSRLPENMADIKAWYGYEVPT